METREAHERAIAVDVGRPTTLSTTDFDCRQKAAFAIVGELGLASNPEDNRAPWTRGQLLIVAAVASSSSEIDFLGLEVNVIGMLGGVRDVVGRFAFGPGNLETKLAFDQPYDKFIFEARQVVDGVGSSADVARQLGFMATARVWRS